MKKLLYFAIFFYGFMLADYHFTGPSKAASSSSLPQVNAEVRSIPSVVVGLAPLPRGVK